MYLHCAHFSTFFMGVPFRGEHTMDLYCPRHHILQKTCQIVGVQACTTCLRFMLADGRRGSSSGSIPGSSTVRGTSDQRGPPSEKRAGPPRPNFFCKGCRKLMTTANQLILEWETCIDSSLHYITQDAFKMEVFNGKEITNFPELVSQL